jgi:type IV pilus assembly protein PilA
MNAPTPHQASPTKKGLSTGCIVAIVVTAVMVLVVLPIFATLGIYGVRRYLASAKSAEAKNSVSAIARAAAAGYEREPSDGSRPRLCASAAPVPRSVPRGTKYMPSSASGADFDRGNEREGWRCLRFALSHPTYYQYHYNANGGYRTSYGSAAGASGFEALAVGDLDADGVESHFVRRGQIGPGGTLVLDTQIFIDNEFE